MSVTNPIKTINKTTLDCNEIATVTIGFDAAPEINNNPTDIVLVMDRSASTSGEAMRQAKIAAKQLIDTVAKASGDSTGATLMNGTTLGLVSFATAPTQNQDLTTDVSRLNIEIDKLSTGGSTNHRGAFISAKDMLKDSTKQRKIIIMFTDGETNTGGDPLPIVDEIKNSGIEIYCIGLLKDATILTAWASTPTDNYIATTNDPKKLTEVFDEIAAEVVSSGVLDLNLTETLNPEFKIMKINAVSHGVAKITSPQSINWTAGSIATTNAETATLSFDVMNISTFVGDKNINENLVYSDRNGTTLTFPNPTVKLICTANVIYPDKCATPKDVMIESCKDSVTVVANNTEVSGLGRLVKVDARVKNICPGKRVSAAIILTEVDADGVEHNRGIKNILIPAQAGDTCTDVDIKCVTFVVPEALSESGVTDTLCAPRDFRVRVIANYVDTDYVCCDPTAVII